MPVSASAEQRGAAALRFALAFGHAQNFRCVNINQSRIELNIGLRILMAKSSDAKTAEAASAAADLHILGFVSKLGDAAHDDGIDAEQLAQLGGRRGVGAIAVRKVLLGKNLVERLAFDHAIGSVLHQILYQQVGDSLADIDVRSKKRRAIGANGRVVEVEYGDALFARHGCDWRRNLSHAGSRRWIGSRSWRRGCSGRALCRRRSFLLLRTGSEGQAKNAQHENGGNSFHDDLLFRSDPARLCSKSRVWVA